MSEEKAPCPPEAAKAAAPPAPAAAPLKLKVVSDGTPEGTFLVDAATGQHFRVDAHVSIDVMGAPGKGGKARVALVVPDAPVEVSEACKAPFHLLGHSVGGRSGGAPRPGEVSGSIHAPAVEAGAGSPTSNPSPTEQFDSNANWAAMQRMDAVVRQGRK